MSYCSVAEVQALTGTNLSSSILTTYIALADAEIDAMLAEQYASGSAGSNVLKNASLSLVKVCILERYRIDGTKPNSLTIGDMSMGDNVDAAINGLRASAERMIDLYVKQTLGQDQTSTSASLEDTLVRQDHEMPEMNLDQSTIVEYHDRADETGNQSSGEEV